jgi:hypothetical protein
MKFGLGWEDGNQRIIMLVKKLFLNSLLKLITMLFCQHYHVDPSTLIVLQNFQIKTSIKKKRLNSLYSLEILRVFHFELQYLKIGSVLF